MKFKSSSALSLTGSELVHHHRASKRTTTAMLVGSSTMRCMLAEGGWWSDRFLRITDRCDLQPPQPDSCPTLPLTSSVLSVEGIARRTSAVAVNDGPAATGSTADFGLGVRAICMSLRVYIWRCCFAPSLHNNFCSPIYRLDASFSFVDDSRSLLVHLPMQSFGYDRSGGLPPPP